MRIYDKAVPIKKLLNNMNIDVSTVTVTASGLNEPSTPLCTATVAACSDSDKGLIVSFNLTMLVSHCHLYRTLSTTLLLF